MAGRRITDFGGMPHTSDMSMKSETHTKTTTGVEGAGAYPQYPDTDEKIKRDQAAGVKHLKGRPMKEGYRY